ERFEALSPRVVEVALPERDPLLDRAKRGEERVLDRLPLGLAERLDRERVPDAAAIAKEVAARDLAEDSSALGAADLGRGARPLLVVLDSFHVQLRDPVLATVRVGR